MPLTFVLTDFWFAFSFFLGFSLVDFFEPPEYSGLIVDKFIERSFFCDLNFFFNSLAFLLDDGSDEALVLISLWLSLFPGF